MRPQTTPAGFTLVEILIALVLLGIILAISAQGSRSATQSSSEREVRAAIEFAVASGVAEAERYAGDTVVLSFKRNRIEVLRAGVVQTAFTQRIPSAMTLLPEQTAMVQPDGTLLAGLSLTLTAADGAAHVLTIDRAGAIR